MSKKITILILILIAIFIPLRLNENSKKSFEIYLASGDSDNLNELVLSPKPVISDKDIASYKWSAHEIVFSKSFIIKMLIRNLREKNEVDSKPNLRGGSKLLEAPYGTKFVVVVNGERIYFGEFLKPLYYSSINFGPVILDKGMGIAIRFFPASPNIVDMRSDSRIYNILKIKGKLD